MNSITSCNNLGESSYLKHLSAMTMKCNVCGQEFGNGAYCQHCNADRITALGNYSGGYNAPDIPKNVASNTNPGGSDPTSGYSYGNAQDSNYTHKQGRAGNGVEQFMICYHCTNVIPADSEYCPCCGTKLFVVCPKCGHYYSSQYKICNKCGTNREEYLKEQRILEQRWQEEERRKEAERKKQLEKERKLEQQRREEERRRQEEIRRRETEEKRMQEQHRTEELKKRRRETLSQPLKLEIPSIDEQTAQFLNLMDEEWRNIFFKRLDQIDMSEEMRNSILQSETYKKFKSHK